MILCIIWLQIIVHLCSVWRRGEEGEGGGKLLHIITCWGAGIHVCGGEVGEWVNSYTRVLRVCMCICAYIYGFTSVCESASVEKCINIYLFIYLF